MTPHQRRVYEVKSCFPMMADIDLDRAASDETLPTWARRLYAAELKDRLGDDPLGDWHGRNA